MKPTFLLLSSILFINASVYCADYRIAETAAPFFANKNAYDYTVELLKSHPEIQRRMLDPSYQPPNQKWAYANQSYGSQATMLHLIALQVKAMAEQNEIHSPDDILHPDWGIGSKKHKDKGTIKNPLSFFGHPVQKEVLNTNSKIRTLKVYHAFRRTIKNELIHFARNQPLKWHQQNLDIKLKSTMRFLQTEHPKKTLQLRDQLKKYQIVLELLLHKALSSNLLSESSQLDKKVYTT